MGGQFDYWGFWLSCDYGVGQSSEVCTTFRNYKQLSKSKDFRIRNLEVWGVGELEDEEDDEVCLEMDLLYLLINNIYLFQALINKTSILNKNLEDRVMLELAGQKMHSDGLREDRE